MKNALLLCVLVCGFFFDVYAQKYHLSVGLEPNFCISMQSTRTFGSKHNFGGGADIQLARPLSRIFWFQFGVGYDHLRFREYRGLVWLDPNGGVIARREAWDEFRVHDLKFPVFLVARIPVGARFWAAPAFGTTFGIQLYKTLLSGEEQQYGRVRLNDNLPLLDRAYITLRLGTGYTLNEKWILFVEPSLGANVRNLLRNHYTLGEPGVLMSVRTSLVHTFGWEPGPTRRTLLRQQRRKVRQLE